MNGRASVVGPGRRTLPRDQLGGLRPQRQLARRPYASAPAVSTWLDAGVPSTQVAEWVGHSLAVLHQLCAKWLSGQDELARRRIEATLRES